MKWRKKRKYGQMDGWMAETAFLTFKTLLESMYPQQDFKMIKEMMIKVSLYDLFRRI
nr:hypothetical protein [Candidatus Nitrosocosmicus sp. SS]